MSSDPSRTEILVPIVDVERQTGIRQGTLRMWEKRYGFPRPLRNQHGDRVYPVDQVERLQAVRRLIDKGLRPGKIFSDMVALESAYIAPRSATNNDVPAHVQHVLNLLRAYRLAELHSHFQHRLMDLGLRRFVIEFLAPLSTQTGLAWNRGELPVRCEHLFTQVAKSFLHAKQAAVRTADDGRPKVLLATLTGEPHVLGIMMAEAVMASFEMNCIQLGAETPPAEVVAAARETAAGIVALSFSAHFPQRAAIRLGADVHAALPHGTELWIGGDGARGIGKHVSGAFVFQPLEAIESGLQRWRSRNAA